MGWSLADAAAVEARVDGTTATYPGVLPETDLELVARPDGVKETLVLASEKAASEWVFPLALDGLAAREGEGGTIELVDAKGKLSASIPAPFMQDSSVDEKTRLPARSSAVSMRLVIVNGGPAIELAADREWLADPERVYPVRVDPTVTAQPDENILTDGDVFVDSDPETGASVQNGDYLSTGIDEAGVKSRTFLQFDIDSAVTPEKPTIFDAHVRLHLMYRPECSAAPMYVHEVEEEWTSADLAGAEYPGPRIDTSGNRWEPPAEEACTNTALDPSVGGWIPASANSLIEGWTSGRNLGLAVTADESDPAQRALYTSADYADGAYAPTLVLVMTDGLPPQVDTRRPRHGDVVQTLTPDITVRGHDPDGPGDIHYTVDVYDEDGVVVHSKDFVQPEGEGSATTRVPAGTLRWNTTYSWKVHAHDESQVHSGRSPRYSFYTRAPQPALGSKLAQNPGKGYNPDIGNYTTSATEAQVAGVGPALEISRSYNSLDTRHSGAFGRGWSSLLDARVAERVDEAGDLRSVVVTYPDGSAGGFGPYPDGKFEAPAGRTDVLTAVRSGGSVTGYRLRTTQETFVFARPVGGREFRPTSVEDGNGLSLTFTYDGSGRVSRMTSASGRSLDLTWDSAAGEPHVTRVTPSGQIDGADQSWEYTYAEHDRLTKVCPPAGSCTTYTWDNSANQGANAALDQAPSVFWRLNEPTGSTVASSSVLGSGGSDMAFHENTTAGSTPSPWPGSTSGSTSFTGSSSRVRMPARGANDGSRTVSLWFKTTTPGRVLLSYQSDPITASTTEHPIMPMMYIGSSGKLYTKIRAASHSSTMSTPESVTDGEWHHAALVDTDGGEVLYLDGERQASTSGVADGWDYWGTRYQYIGAGFLGLEWPDQPYDTQQRTFFAGQIADVAFFDHALSASDVAEMHAAAVNQSWQLSKVAKDSGRTVASLSMDAVTGRLSSMTDSDGGTWTMGAPQVAGTSDIYADAVRASRPTDYWRLRETSGVLGLNETGADAATIWAPLRAGGPFADGTAVSFTPPFTNPSSGWTVDLPGGAVAPGGASTQELWFKTGAPGSVLLSAQSAPLKDSPSGAWPMLWIDDNGRLRGLSAAATPTGPLTSGFAGKCMQASSGDSGAVRVAMCDGSTLQSWQHSGTQLKRGGSCLIPVGSGSANGTKVKAQACRGVAAEQWEPMASGGRWRHVASGRCLDAGSGADGVQLTIRTCTNAARQQWAMSLVSPDRVDDNTWHHAVLTREAPLLSTTQTLYLDGVKVQSTTGALPLWADADYGYLGAGDAGNGWSGLPPDSTSYYHGRLAEAAFYDRALNADDVTAHYQSAGRTAPLVVTAGDVSGRRLADTAAGSLPAQALTPGVTAVDHSAQVDGITAVSNPVKVVSVTDPGGHRVTDTFDLVTGQRAAHTDALGNTTLYGRDSGGFTSLEIDPNGIVTRSVQDERGHTIQRVTCQDQAEKKCSSSYYDYYWNDDDRADPRNGKLLAERGPGSAGPEDDTYLTSYTYDAAGNLLTTTDPVGRTTTITYTDGTSVPASGGGQAPRGLPWKVVDASGGLRTMTYTAAGDLATVVDPAGAKTTYEYDAQGRQLTETVSTSTFPEGRTTTYTYDAVGRVVTQTDPAVTNRVTGAVHTPQMRNLFDGPDGDLLAGQVVSDLTGGDPERVTEWTYDEHGRRASETAATGDRTSYEYDVYGHLVKQSDPDGTVSTYAVDANGNQLSRTIEDYTGDPNDPQEPEDLVVESATYDPAGRMASSTDAMGYTVDYTYTDDGRTATVTRSDGDTSFVLERNSYDAAGNLKEQRSANGRTVTRFGYDAAGRQIRIVQDPSGIARNTFLKLAPDDQVISQVTRDSSGNLLEAIDYAYDVLGRSVSETRFGGDPATTPVARWRLDEIEGSTAADTAGNTPGTATGVRWKDDPQRGPVAVFDRNTSQITTAGPVVDTTNGYTVAAWLRADRIRSDATVLEIPGVSDTHPAFRLSFDAAAKGWRAETAGHGADGEVAVSSRIVGQGSVRAGAWQHVAVGVSPQSKLWTIFLDGVKVGSFGGAETHSVAVGGVRVGGSASRMFRGAISDLQMYQQVSYDDDWAVGVADGTVPGAATGVSRTSSVLDTGGLATAVVDARGNTTHVSHDEADRPVMTVGPPVQAEPGDGPAVTARAVTTIGYNAFGDVVEESDPNGHVTTYEIDQAGRQQAVRLPGYTPPGTSAPINARTVLEYDPMGQLVSHTDPLGRTTTLAYDQLGRPVTEVAPDGGTTTTRYDLLGNVLSVTDPNEAVTGFAYDLLGNLTSVDEAVRQAEEVYTTTGTYDDAGRLAMVTTPAGVSATYGYDALGQVTSMVDGAGETTSVVYDVLGRAVKQVDPDGGYTVTDFDMLSRPTSSAAYSEDGGPALATTSWGYDAAGNAVAVTDARGATTRFGYDAAGRMATESQPVDADTSIDTSFGYDLAGNPTRFTDGRGNAFTTTYTPWDLVQSRIEPATEAHPDPADRTFTTVYDAAGQAVSQRVPGGVTRTFAYDEAGRLTRQAGSGAEAETADRDFGYDAAGRLTQFSAPGGTNTVAYDDRGLPVSLSGPSGDASFTYTPDGLMASRTDVAGTTSYGYDDAARLASVKNTEAGVSIGYTYTAMSEVASMTFGDSGNRRVFGYDDLHRLTSDTLADADGDTIASIAYGWDASGNETSKVVTLDGATTTDSYTYDLANRLTSWDDGATTVGYRYDASGNRTGVGDVDYVYDQRNRLVSDTEGRGFTYTARGTRASESGAGTSITTVADAFDQVVTQASAGATRSYGYDALGRVLRDGFAYSGLQNDLATDGGTGYLRDPDGDVTAVTTGSTSRLVWTDLHDDVVAQLDTNGAEVTASRSYSPLGEVTSEKDMLGSLGYQSEWTDPATGRVNMHARWYDPGTAQFGTRDGLTNSPVPDSIAANRYQYGDGNPLVVTDPSGHRGKFLDRVKNAGKKIREGFRDAGRRVRDLGRSAVDYAKDRVDEVRQSVTRAYEKITAIGTGLLAAAERVSQWAHTARDWIVEHKAEIVGAIVGMIVEAACLLAVGWTGVGVAACGMAAGALGGLVTGAMEGHTGLELLHDAAMGGLAGGLGAALPMMGAAAAKAVSKAAAPVAKAVAGRAGKVVTAGRRAARGAGRATRELAEHADDAARGTSRVGGRADEAVAAGDGYVDDAVRSGGSRSDDVADTARACVRHSFDPDTRVQMADGTTQKISEVKLDDEVLATDPETGETSAQPVRVLHRNDDRDLVDVTVTDTATGEWTEVRTTAHHPFWNATTGRWTDAEDLEPGDVLRGSDGRGTQQVSSVKVRPGPELMNDLTVAGVHTYYVLADDTPVLVHNCGGEAAGQEAATRPADGVSLTLKYKEGWSHAQKQAADEKVAALNAADRLVVTQVKKRSGPTASQRYRAAGHSIPPGSDVDHVIDLQLGGADDLMNMKPLDSSVNRSLGAQISGQTRKRKLLPGTLVCRVSICPRRP
ncbi:ricin-type beta-trefoil lectin domain protein [Phycicoccus sp. CSK15P-2]|uniref:LamG-like jellyroll fold domain-containing protein n=1 Tax=Phycicoccus sp. CSK15P-2 TaxID=2807627 RepID=UPI0019524DE3|nr:LamG-like jellyroll fold domain-containing protein [Phycicoccus sp. CSK15P-2]MBM6403444.1 ricin-type beta-trefoil lectin domain protein [Phycicoccus sp. CSK15P-2]